MDGLASVLARISAIEARFGDRPTPTPPAAAAVPATAFDAVLQNAAIATAPATPASETTANDDDAQNLPVGLAAYENGRIPTSALTPIDDSGHLLSASAASAFQRMTAAAGMDGVSIGVNDAYRPIEDQARLAKAKGLYSQGGLAATPGTSAHGWGLAVDLGLDDQAQTWMRTNARRYGFVEDVPREPWHWTYRPNDNFKT